MFTNFEVDTLHLHDPARDRATPEVHLVSRVKLWRPYLRAAHAYMLISMPTGTSTIFGVFQAILAFLFEPDDFRPPG
jgi:hypothetical protein